jgi:hypothetical protein
MHRLWKSAANAIPTCVCLWILSFQPVVLKNEQKKLGCLQIFPLTLLPLHLRAGIHENETNAGI